MNNELVTVAPEVTSLAKTSSEVLLSARYHIQRNPKIQALFGQASTSDWTSDELADALSLLLSEDLEYSMEDLYQASLYLADEYRQMGGTRLIISTETGKAITQLSEADIVPGPMVPREDGRMVQGLPRIDPKVEAALIQWIFDRGQEGRIEAALIPRLNQTPGLRKEGDNRLLVVSRAGRTTIVDHLRSVLSELLPNECKGISRDFLNLFEIRKEAPSGLTELKTVTAHALIRSPLAGPTSTNIHYDHLTALKAKVAVQWVREIALTLSRAACDADLKEQEIAHEDWVSGNGVTVSAPDTATVLEDDCLVVPGAETVVLRRPVGAIVFDPDSFECDDRERLGSWDVVALCKLTLYVDWDRVQRFYVTGVPVAATIIA